MTKNTDKRKRLKRKGGFTLMELLVAMAIMLLLTMMLSSLMSTATLAYEKSIKCANADVHLTNAVNKLRLELSDAKNVKAATAADFENTAIQAQYNISGCTLSGTGGLFYTDAATGAECLIFYGKNSGDTENNIYISKYGIVNPLVFTTDDLTLEVGTITINSKTVVFTSLSAKNEGTTYSSVSEVSVKLQ